MRGRHEIGDNDMTAPIDTITAGNHSGHICCPHKRAAHGEMYQIGGTSRCFGEDVRITPTEARVAQKTHLRPGKRWQDGLRKPQGKHLAHFRESLSGSLPRATLPSGVRHASPIAKAQASKVVCW